MALFLGYSFPFRKSSGGFPAPATDDALIKEDLIQLVLTGAKERYMRPSLGSNVYRYVFENNDELLQERIEADLVGLIGQYEPRVSLLGVGVERGDQANEATATTVKITISYLVLATRKLDTAEISFSNPGGGTG